MNLYRNWVVHVLAALLAVPSAVWAQSGDVDYGAVPALTRPQGDQAAANQKLDFHTDLFTGRFNYQIPVELPPGRQGSEPSIALQYNSSDGNGWCGVGWDLDMGYIQRDTRHGVPISGVTAYSDSFGFIYSVAGQSGRLVLASDGTYRPEINTSFLKFVHTVSGTNDFWVVTDKSGNSYTFGGAPFSQIYGPYGVSGTFKWMLNSIQDPNGNQTTLTYQNPDYGVFYGYETDYQLYLHQISYNANANNSLLTNNCTVTFSLSTRSDFPNSCLSGQEISTFYSLSDILVSNNNQLVRDYYLQYSTSPSTGRSLLQYVTEYGTDDVTFWPSKTFYYSEMSQSFQPPQLWNITSQSVSAADPYWTSPSTPDTKLIDINGDGLPDWVSSENFYNRTYYAVQTNSGSGFGPVQYWPISNETSDPSDLVNTVNQFYVPGSGKAFLCDLVDINGDGLPDRVMIPRSGTGYFQVQTNTGNGFGSSILQWQNVSSVDSTYTPELTTAVSYANPGSIIEAMLVDMNGDGLPDLLMLGSTANEFRVTLNEGAAAHSFQAGTMAWDQVAGTDGIRYEDTYYGGHSDLVDMNGDGLPDRIVPGNVQLNLGSWGNWGNFNNEQSWGMTNSQPFALIDWTTACFATQLIDINGDGLPDLVSATNSGVATNNSTYTVRYNTGSGFSAPVLWTGINTSNSYTYGLQAWDSSSTKTEFIDMNGDGLPDRVMRNNIGGINCLVVQLNSGPFPDLMIEADNGIGGYVTVTYTNSTVFNNSDGTRSRLPFPVHVVTSVHSDGNMGSGETTAYNYQYGLYDTIWREFRGFGVVDATDFLGTTTETYFHQGGGMDLSSHGEYQDSRFKAGMPYDVITYGSDGLKYKETLSQITQVEVDPNGVYFPFVTNVFEMDSEPSVSPRATLTQYAYAVTNNLAQSTGNLLSEAFLGEVTNVSYSDTYSSVSDLSAPVYTTYTYAALSNPKIVDKPASVNVSSDAAANNILRQTKYQYFGATGNLQEKSELICPGTFANTFYTYDNYGNPVSITDPMGIVTTLDYDPGSATFAWRKSTGTLTNTFRFDPRDGEVLSATNEQGLVTANAYDTLLRLTNTAISTTPYGTPSLARARYIYKLTVSPAYVQVSKNDPASSSGWHDTYTYVDGMGRPAQVRDQSETNNSYRVTDIGYDARGELLWQSYPVFSSGSSYVSFSGTRTNAYSVFDAIGRPYIFNPCGKVTLSGGEWTAYPTALAGDAGSPVGPTSVSYHDGNNPWALVVTNALGKIHKYLLDSFGRTNQIVEVTANGNFTTKLVWDRAGDLTNITDNAGNQIGLFYDLLGENVAVTDPDMGFWQYTHDLDGRLVTQTDAKGQQIKFYYSDPAGRLTRREGWTAASQCVSTNTWQYDSSGGDTACTVFPGQLYKVTDDEGLQKFSYDARDRTLESIRYLVKNGNSYTNQFTFDDADRLTSTACPNGGPVVTNSFDAGEHLSRVSIGTTNFYAAKGFNALSQLNGINFGNGVATTLGYFNVSKRLNQIITIATGSTTIQSFTNRYDAVGNVVGLQDLASSHTNSASATISSASYDDLNRLLTATWSGYGTKNYGYDSIGNVLTNGESGSGAYNYGSGAIRPDCVRSANGAWYTYDLNGNMVFRTGQRLNYDVNNHLYQVINTNGIVTTFGYDAGGVRLWEKISTNSLQVWIGDDYEEKNGQVLYHILANGRTICTFDKTGTNVYEYYHPDYLTSTSLQTDKNGNEIQHFEYSAFGQTRYTQSTNVFKVSRLYTGQVQDDSTGLYYFGNWMGPYGRPYDPQLGKFMQPDDLIPDIFDPQSYNRYAYCVNNPLRFTDPSGHSIEDYVAGMFGLSQFRADAESDNWAKNVANKGGNLGFKSFADAQNYLAEQKDPAGLNADKRLADERNHAISTTAASATGLGGAYITVEATIVAPEVEGMVGETAEIHHIATDKNLISTAAGGPYTPKFETIFKKAGMTLQDVLNKVPVLGHQGPHPEYNAIVYERLQNAVKGLKGDAYKTALQNELKSIGKESTTSGTKLNKLITDTTKQ
jgi:RHS repeat-associated protein